MLKIEDLYLKYMGENIENRITNHLVENDPEFKSSLEECHSMTPQFELLIHDEVFQYDDIHYRKFLLEEMKLLYAFKEGFLMATQILQEVTPRN